MCNSAKLAKSGSFSDSGHPKPIYLANGTSLPSIGSGSVPLSLYTSKTKSTSVILQNVLFVPGLSKNLISVAACVAQGIDVLFDHPTQLCYLKKNGATIGVASRNHGLWVLHTHPKFISYNSKSATTTQAMGASTTPPTNVSEGNGCPATTYLASTLPMAAVSVQNSNRRATRHNSIRPHNTNCRRSPSIPGPSFRSRNSSKENSRTILPDSTWTTPLKPAKHSRVQPMGLRRTTNQVAVKNSFAALSNLT